MNTRLALAHTLIQAHGGRLELKLRPGMGTRATVVFPLARLLGTASSAA
jgi:signal transduction histidine kinase